MDEIKILGIVGNLSKDSYTHLALKAAQDLVPDGATLSLVELHGIPSLDQGNKITLPTAVLELKRQIMAADAILFATPEHNDSVSRVLMNAIDWASMPLGKSAWSGKPAAVMGASIGSMGTARAQQHLRIILAKLDMPAVDQPEVMISNAPQRFDRNGRLIDEPIRQSIKKLLGELVQLVKAQSCERKPALLNQA